MNTIIQFQQYPLSIDPLYTQDDAISLATLAALLKPAPHTISQALVIKAELNEVLQVIQETHQYIEAAGGLVQNKDGALLMIFRRGFWDLPKGKIDKGEVPKQAALREVMEETGVAKLALGHHVGDTYHTYFMYGGYAVKKTYWYAMTNTEPNDLVPQTEEDIEEVRWVLPKDIAALLPLTYPNIQHILLQWLAL